jgi:anti-anti-sigma factor
MKIEKTALGDLDVLSLSGEFESGSAAQFDSAIDAQIDDYRTRIVVDLGGITFLDSQGLTRLIAAQRKLVPLGGEHVVCGANMAVQTTFKTVGLNEMIRMFPDVDEARTYFESPERAQAMNLEGVPIDEAVVGRIDVEIGLSRDEDVSITGKLLSTYPDGLFIRSPADAERAAFGKGAIDVGQSLWLRFRQPMVARDHEFAVEAQVTYAYEADNATKYRVKFTKIDDHDQKLMRDFAAAQDAMRKYGKPPEET